MPIAPGSRLGPYEVAAPLGAGGMGEVYRARDTRLGREVAVKVLPQHLSSDPEVRARFEREARTVSALNHPHICVLHDVGREGETDYLVMELVEGETLAQRLARGPLSAAEVLRLGAQIADALDRAHRAGVVHRDLKPGNVMLTRGGAKLMDFGLARAGMSGAGGATMSAVTHTPTLAQPLTAEGTIVGTFQYMAPEQLEGREADPRSDLWALGCVLYEMATGRRAYDGATQASLISAIMRDTPRPIAELAPLSPPGLDRLVAALLAKDPEERVQTAHDARLQLGWLAAPDSRSSAAATLAASPLARRLPAATIAGLALALLGFLALVLAGPRLWPRDEKAVVTEIPLPEDLRLAPFWSSMALSPEGDRVAAVLEDRDGEWQVWMWRLDSPTPTPVPGTSGAGIVGWSPDGRALAIMTNESQAIGWIPAEGGSPTRMATISDARGFSWGAKGVLVYAPAASGPLMRVPAGGGTPEPATELDTSRGEAGHRSPYFLPDGEHFLFSVLPRGPGGYSVRVGSLRSRQSTLVLEAESGVCFVEPGYLLFVHDGKLTAQRFDLRTRRCVGERITLGDAPSLAELDADRIATAGAGGRLLLPEQRPARARLEWLDRTGASRGVIPLPESDWEVKSLAPDQRSALATAGGDLWQVDLERGLATRLLAAIDPFQRAEWSPDGRRVAATSRRGGREVLLLLTAGGGGTPDTVRGLTSLFVEARGWSPDGRALLVAGLGSGSGGGDRETSWDLFHVPLDGGAPRALVATGAYEREAWLSPDGRWLAYSASDAGQSDLFIAEYPDGGRRTLVRTTEGTGGIRAAWGRDSRELIVRVEGEPLVSVPLTESDLGLEPGKPTPWFEPPREIGRLETRDGERFLVSRRESSTGRTSMRLVQHWTGLLRR